MTAAIILAAGMSSRMGRFKPLLPLGGEPLIRSSVQRLIEGGVNHIVVVTGHQSGRLAAALGGLPASLVHNERYQETPMSHSFFLALSALPEKIRVCLVLPGDIPMFLPDTVQLILQKAGLAQVTKPVFSGRSGHPVAIRRDAFACLLARTGKGESLKAALNGLTTQFVNTQDKGILLDADTPEDFEALLAYRRDTIPARYEEARLIEQFETPDAVIRHCEAVEAVAAMLAKKAAAKGCPINEALVRAGARLHDIARTKAQHAAQGAAALEEIGYHRTAEIIRIHMDLPADRRGRVDEGTLVYLADKMVLHTAPITLEERLAHTLQKCAANPEAAAKARRRLNDARDIYLKIAEGEL